MPPYKPLFSLSSHDASTLKQPPPLSRDISSGYKEPHQTVSHLPWPPLLTDPSSTLAFLQVQLWHFKFHHDQPLTSYTQLTQLPGHKTSSSSRNSWISCSFHFSKPFPWAGISARVSGFPIITLILSTFSLLNSQCRCSHKTYNKGFILHKSKRKGQTTKRKWANDESTWFRQVDLRRPLVIWLFFF